MFAACLQRGSVVYLTPFIISCPIIQQFSGSESRNLSSVYINFDEETFLVSRAILSGDYRTQPNRVRYPINPFCYVDTRIQTCRRACTGHIVMIGFCSRLHPIHLYTTPYHRLVSLEICTTYRRALQIACPVSQPELLASQELAVTSLKVMCLRVLLPLPSLVSLIHRLPKPDQIDLS